MGNFFSVRPAKVFQITKEESWIERVKQNARAFFELRGAPVLAHGGSGAFDLLEGRTEPGRRKRQAGSIVVHAVAIGILLWLGGRTMPREGTLFAGLLKDPGPLRYHSPKILQSGEKPSLGRGSGGDKGLLAPGAGELARQTRIVLLHPRIPDQQVHAMPVEPTVVGEEELRKVRELGLPWMKDKTNSNGKNGTDGIGDGPGHTMGVGKEDGTGGADDPNGYVAGAYPAKCLYCPDPEYTDEARHEKLQGNVTLHVLVTADGRASRLSIVRGLGLGLDERAMETVRKWRFEPARDAKRNALSQWVTVEVTYRLF